MSYIIAFVRFPESDSDYPANCFRTDLQKGDAVVVRLGDGRLRPAVVEMLQYLNWQCRAVVECKVSEAVETGDGTLTSPPGSPLHVGLATHQALARVLKVGGWVPLLHRSNVYTILFSFTNKTQTANILFRKNGVDLQILPERLPAAPVPMSSCDVSIAIGQVVRHHLAHTTFNLFEGIHRFAKAFANESGDYERFFVSVGSRDKRTSKQKNNSPRPRNELLEIYGAISGRSGGDGYLGDGIWIDSGGGMHDRGR